MADTNRIAKELREIASDTASGVTVSPHGDSLTHMKGTITGAWLMTTTMRREWMMRTMTRNLKTHR